MVKVVLGVSFVGYAETNRHIQWYNYVDLCWLPSLRKSKQFLRRFTSWINSEPALAPAQNQHLVCVGQRGYQCAATCIFESLCPLRTFLEGNKYLGAKYTQNQESCQHGNGPLKGLFNSQRTGSFQFQFQRISAKNCLVPNIEIWFTARTRWFTWEPWQHWHFSFNMDMCWISAEA